jgi:ABC-type Zn2+ transport system substrate-binding protein/surface adhesin
MGRLMDKGWMILYHDDDDDDDDEGDDGHDDDDYNDDGDDGHDDDDYNDNDDDDYSTLTTSHLYLPDIYVNIYLISSISTLTAGRAMSGYTIITLGCSLELLSGLFN